jgi:hypothetical protein
MPDKMICCISLPPATRLSVPIYDFAEANLELAREAMEESYTCCGKRICGGSGVSPETISVRFAIQTEVAKQMKRIMKRF